MSDLIKREDAIREVTEPFDEYMWDGVLHPIRYIVDALKAVPSVDAVSVVRCEECRKSHIDGKTTHHLWCTEWGRSTDTFGYCERGEREGE